MSARDGHNLDHMKVFDEGCVKSRLKDLTVHFIAKFATEDMRRLAEEQRRAFQPVTPYPFNPEEVQEKFFEQAKKEAEKILEIERQNLVDHESDYITKMLKARIKTLKELVYDNNANKLKMYAERTVNADSSGRWDMRDIVYVGNHNFALLTLIGNASPPHYLNDYEAYMNDEVKALFNEANSLSSLEIVRIETGQKNGKTEKAEAT